jgi:TPR repeat protein
MSTEAEEEVAVAADNMCMCCASCGTVEIDDIKLKNCDDGCDLVKYCSDACQKNHREQHDEECKTKLAEKRDDDLFAMPDSCLGNCSICCLPQPLDAAKPIFMPCCSQSICMGCHYANQMREKEAGLEHRCAFCREPVPTSKEEVEKYMMKRVKKNCPVAMSEMGKMRRNEGDHETAFEYFTKAAELGDADAHFYLSRMYDDGRGVEKDEKKEVYHLEQAAIGGHPHARHNLGAVEMGNVRYERALKHFIIAAHLGLHNSLKWIRQLYESGDARKEDYTCALRGYQATVDATKSPERKRAEEAIKNGELTALG